MQKLNRALQRQILEYLRGIYPEFDEDLSGQEFGDDPDLWGNVKYLQEQGLLTGTDLRVYGVPFCMQSLRLTPAGLDFLENDGGIDALKHINSAQDK